MNKYPISIVIPCSDDVLIKNCLDSIDVEVEIVVSLNRPSRAVRDILIDYPQVKIIETDKQGIALAYNNGIEASDNDWILLMDSDCTFSPGSIFMLWSMTSNFLVIKGKTIFLSTDFVSSIIAKVREFTTSDKVNAYSPPLLFNKNIIKHIGYYFHPYLVWSEDGDFNNRIKSNNIPIAYVPEATILHKPLKFSQDIKSAFRYGIGRQIGKDLKVYKPHTIKSFFGNVILVLTNTFSIIVKKGFFSAIYYFLFWNSAFRLGTFLQNKFHLYKHKKL